MLGSLGLCLCPHTTAISKLVTGQKCKIGSNGLVIIHCTLYLIYLCNIKAKTFILKCLHGEYREWRENGIFSSEDLHPWREWNHSCLKLSKSKAFRTRIFKLSFLELYPHITTSLLSSQKAARRTRGNPKLLVGEEDGCKIRIKSSQSSVVIELQSA